MHDVIVGMALDVAMLKTAFGNAIKAGPVAEVDKAKGYRIRLGGSDEKPFLSPWYPHPETGKTSVPLKVGQVVGIINPSGDPRKGFLLRGGYSADHASPNEDMAANVFSDAGVTVKVANGALTIAAGGVTVEISGAGLTVNGGEVRHNDKDIGESHRHGGVVHGGEITEVPV